MIELPPDVPWRAGTKHHRGNPNHRTLYVDQGQGANDPMIGLMDTPALADLVVRTRAVLIELVRLHDSDRPPAAEEYGKAWEEARTLLAAPIRVPDDV